MRQCTIDQISQFSPLFGSGTIHDFGGNTENYRSVQGYDLTRIVSGKVVTVDIKDQPGVDVVDDLHTLHSMESASIEAAICSDVLEHVANPWLVAQALARVIKPGGVLYVATVFVYPIHGDRRLDGETIDYYRFTPQGLRLLFERDFEPVEWGFQDGGTRQEIGVAFLGRRRETAPS